MGTFASFEEQLVSERMVVTDLCKFLLANWFKQFLRATQNKPIEHSRDRIPVGLHLPRLSLA